MGTIQCAPEVIHHVGVLSSAAIPFFERSLKLNIHFEIRVNEEAQTVIDVEMIYSKHRTCNMYNLASCYELLESRCDLKT